ncbi:MAG: methylmalonyl Co-A mutase-associated GTPase MeaB [Thermomicrobiales bacterium]|nr:methylmalonyl Co-A mutase-associated GTPase MeaB [Thermomicrobiales bacterium]
MKDDPDRKPSLAEATLAGDRRALARVLTHIENDTDLGRRALDTLFPHTGNAHIIGITGPPGGGKSTLVNEFIRTWRKQGRQVAVIAVDPSSPLTGGATLGDRIRMQEWFADDGVFVRSMASRRFGGGLAQNTLAVAHAFDAAGFDPIVIETVGTGQDEVSIAALAMTTLLIQVPGTGDGVQSLKAGSLEIGDVLVVTKGDRPEAAELARDLRNIRMIGLAAGSEVGGWEVPVVRTSAITGDGIDNLTTAIASHRQWLQTSGDGAQRVRAMIAAEISVRVQQGLLGRLSEQNHDHLEALIDRVVSRNLTAARAADELLSGM